MSSAEPRAGSRKFAHVAAVAVFGLAIVLLGAVAVHRFGNRLRIPWGGSQLASLDNPRMPSNIRSGQETVLVFIASSTCGASQDKALPGEVRQLRETLRSEAENKGQQFSFVGVALDWSVAKGLEFLSPFGPFDEVTSGRNWMNSGAVSYIVRDIPGTPAIPQVVVLHRTVRFGPSGLTVGNDSLVARLIGREQMTGYRKQHELRASREKRNNIS
jgi:hypothetical protein